MEKSNLKELYIDKKEVHLIEYQDPFFTEVAQLAYHKREAATGQTFSKDFKAGYLDGCSSTLKSLYGWEELDMTSAETFEMLKAIDQKLDKLNEKVSSMDVRLASIETENKLTWKSKQIWIPVMCSIIVAVLGAIFEGKLHF